MALFFLPFQNWFEGLQKPNFKHTLLTLKLILYSEQQVDVDSILDLDSSILEIKVIFGIFVS